MKTNTETTPMSEYSDKKSAQTIEDTEERCFEARRNADFWAANCKEMKTEQEIIEEANKKYNSFFERDHFIKEAEEVFMLKAYRKKQNT